MKTDRLRDKYRLASLYYDILDWPFEQFRYKAIRPIVWKGLGGKILDLGAGTGKNAPYYPKSAQVVSADLSPEMLARARKRIESTGRTPELVVTDALALDFKTGEFDSCVSTFLFCVLPDEVQVEALREIKRVLKPGGTVVLLEYVYSKNRWRRFWMKALAPMVEMLYGARFDRKTAEHMKTAGFDLVERRFVHDDIILLLVGR